MTLGCLRCLMDMSDLIQALLKYHFAEFGAAEARFLGKADIPLVVSVIEAIIEFWQYKKGYGFALDRLRRPPAATRHCLRLLGQVPWR